MSHEQVLEVLKLLLEATKSGTLTWKKSVDSLSDWYSTELAGREICFRQLYFEATNQIGADPYMFDLHMPGLNDCFACGTEGYKLMMEILWAGGGWENRGDPEFAIRFLRESLADKPNNSAGEIVQES
jgi:hypothetical protein